jgi:hypothetical protein
VSATIAQDEQAHAGRAGADDVDRGAGAKGWTMKNRCW